MHRAALSACGLAGSYQARRVDESGLRAGIAELRSGELDGANITMPFKATACELVDRAAPEAARAGSVNSWVKVDGEVVGYSTDVSGIRTTWSRKGLPREAVLILGAGGAAAAALVALEGLRIRVSARRPGAAAALLERVGVEGAVHEWGAPLPGHVVVNGTPLGMDAETLPVGVVEASSGLFEMAYGWDETPAVTRARRAGLPVADGIDLLAAQAEESFWLWTGVVSPSGLMENVARNTSRHSGSEPNHS